jgi:hypothetical protein
MMGSVNVSENEAKVLRQDTSIRGAKGYHRMLNGLGMSLNARCEG